MNFFAQLITWINAPVNALGRFLLEPIGVLPGWLSNTIISAFTGLLLLIIFKYTSNQRAIGRVRDDIKADMLALKLFKDSLLVTLQSQARLFKGALLLLLHSLQPMLVMIVPVILLLGQLALWYQHRPLRIGEEVVVTMQFSGEIDSALPKVEIDPAPASEVVLGPVRVFSGRRIYWKIRACENGLHSITFRVNEQPIEKQLAIGNGFMRVSVERPGWNWPDILRHPLEKPFSPDSLVRSISIDYPPRLSRTSGTDWWLIYFFIASMVFAMVFKPFLKVRI
jgi:uncharacterized membrane protein (DUF106 family)